MLFEALLNNNVKFGSLNEVIEFINHIVNETPYRRFDDKVLLDEPYISVEDCFAKLILSCGFRWIPNEKEMDIIWTILNNLSPEDVTRVYYKNNLFNFVENSKVMSIIETILTKLKKPFLFALDVPEEIQDEIKLLGDLLMEYVYYKYMYMDRKDKNMTMNKSVVMISDTDSCIISLDGWYRFIAQKMSGKEFKFAAYNGSPIEKVEYDDFGDRINMPKPIVFQSKAFDYNFMTEEIEEKQKYDNPLDTTSNDNVKFSIINILAYVIDRMMNDYMTNYSANMHSVKITDTAYTIPDDKEIELYKKVGNGISIVKSLPIINYQYNRRNRMVMKNEFIEEFIILVNRKIGNLYKDSKLILATPLTAGNNRLMYIATA